MPPLQDKDTIIKVTQLAHDSDYYNNVFKKTEKLVSVTFYILSHTMDDEHVHALIGAIKDKGFALHEAALRTLSLVHHNRERGFADLQLALVALESTLRVAHAASLITAEVLGLIEVEIDTVQRYLRHHYLQNTGFKIGQTTPVPSTPAPRPRSSARPSAPRRLPRAAIPAGDISTDAYLVYSQLTDRAERIKTVLEAKPEATIKDIAEVITDVSEKTIQRELNSLIEKGQVIRQGERRWSKYSIKD